MDYDIVYKKGEYLVFWLEFALDIIRHEFTVNCIWQTWSAWETCSVTCGGGGTQVRNRAKTQEASFGGTECTGNDKETRSCNNLARPSMYILHTLMIS